ncbi:DUF559 domain-containing protein [Erythrobacteraceae bacterium CFH 75059]|uniref:endonuclease domain-containing protein n=1 Tax=Qipengyuania thermophila TaxID=2509361 RepID=UPI00102032B2|nr:DUF559 domain-containing protein [Qipengyuania thermophila]TCD06626.1 DUF559 domain-containing protein [Erythrobacteraceae bacterium CFH 75059]
MSRDTLAVLQERARAMRNNPTEPEKRLWRHLSNGQLGGHKFRRQEVIGHRIADFACPVAKVVVEVDGDAHDADDDAVRDDRLEAFGYRVVHVSNADVMNNMEGVLERIRQALPHPDPSPEGEGLARTTLRLRSPGEHSTAPALKKKGRGWEISESRLDALHERAREMRRHSSDAHKALAARFAKADLGRYTFKRHAVVGSAIVDFNCHNLGMAIAIDEEEQDDAIARRRDRSLEAVGIRVMRLKASDILTNIDAVLARITAGMRLRIADKKEAARAHRDATPRQTYNRREARQ